MLSPHSGFLSLSFFPSTNDNFLVFLSPSACAQACISRPAGPFASMSGAGDGASAACNTIGGAFVESVQRIMETTQCFKAAGVVAATSEAPPPFDVCRTPKMTVCHHQPSLRHVEEARLHSGLHCACILGSLRCHLVHCIFRNRKLT